MALSREPVKTRNHKTAHQILTQIFSCKESKATHTQLQFSVLRDAAEGFQPKEQFKCRQNHTKYYVLIFSLAL